MTSLNDYFYRPTDSMLLDYSINCKGNEMRFFDALKFFIKQI